MRYTTVMTLLAVVAGTFLVNLGCSSRKSEPIAGPTVINTPRLISGQEVFMATCYQCHPNGEAGLGPSLNDKPLPSFMIKSQIRKGGGAMPPFDELKISDDELNDVVAYLMRLRQK